MSNSTVSCKDICSGRQCSYSVGLLPGPGYEDCEARLYNRDGHVLATTVINKLNTSVSLMLNTCSDEVMYQTSCINPKYFRCGYYNVLTDDQSLSTFSDQSWLTIILVVMLVISITCIVCCIARCCPAIQSPGESGGS
ncbi:hypothetical protein AMEX_G18185 [Astyanax mexicanus]|uniref:Uncharacterized protein n=1 Tax=Astyanax mexicanus TaxID=7994 RepID=A0A8T2L8L8_ASTMX|nr:hypothetical protein AMEX_G18185 [Astyanax mexicanus]